MIKKEWWGGSLLRYQLLSSLNLCFLKAFLPFDACHNLFVVMARFARDWRCCQNICDPVVTEMWPRWQRVTFGQPMFAAVIQCYLVCLFVTRRGGGQFWFHAPDKPPRWVKANSLSKSSLKGDVGCCCYHFSVWSDLVTIQIRLPGSFAVHHH